MNLKNYKLRCYLTGVKGDYFAACITLNLTASGKTEKSAIANLEKNIKSYLEVVLKDKNPDNYLHLLNRPAPLYMYTDYVKCFIVHHLTKSMNERTFIETAPLTLCMA